LNISSRYKECLHIRIKASNSVFRHENVWRFVSQTNLFLRLVSGLICRIFDARRDALQDVMKLAKKLKDKSGGDKAKKRAAAAGDDERLKSIAAQFESDPDLREAAARVQVRVFEFFEDFSFLEIEWMCDTRLETKYC
jgi:hypothetical protein